jgi:hypothetical protein
MPMATRLKRLPSYTGAMLLLLFGSLAPAGGSAQEAVVPLQFSFSDPGARSMGFGGAFVALADDATAAFSNPAGLTQLLRPEISIEIRHWGYSSPFTEHGRVENLPSGFGIDTTVGLQTATSESDHTGLSFLSFVFPMENWSLAFFRHEYANFEFFSETQGLFYGGTDCCQDRYWDQRSQTDLDILSYGLSAAYRISDRFDLGLGVVYYDASFFSDVEMFLWDEDTIPSVFAPNSYLPERSAFSERIYFDDADWAFTAGFLWRLSETFSVGGVYRQAPEIDVAVTLTTGQAVDFGVPPGEVFRQESGMLELPTLYGLGIAYQSVDGSLTVSFQWDHVEYSNILSPFGSEPGEIRIIKCGPRATCPSPTRCCRVERTRCTTRRVSAWPRNDSRLTSPWILPIESIRSRYRQSTTSRTGLTAIHCRYVFGER